MSRPLLPLLLGAALTVAASAQTSVVVDARSNIYASGRAAVSDPGGGGGGVLPVEISIPPGALSVNFTGITGLVSCCGGSNLNGPDGGTAYSTGVLAYQGISSTTYVGRMMFLVGVFVGPNEPAGSAPNGMALSYNPPSTVYAQIGQTFLIGDGQGIGGTTDYAIPNGATRLFLGYADSSGFNGPHGYYDDNTGSHTVGAIHWTAGPYTLSVTSLQVGSLGTLTIENATPFETQYVGYAFALSPAPVQVPQLATSHNLLAPSLLLTLPADGNGFASYSAIVPAAAGGRTLYFQAGELGRSTNTVTSVVP